MVKEADRETAIIALENFIKIADLTGCQLVKIPMTYAMTIQEVMKETIHCKDCKHFEVKDHWTEMSGIPVLATSDCPTCNRWADGCMTSPDGFCFLAERYDVL